MEALEFGDVILRGIRTAQECQGHQPDNQSSGEPPCIAAGWKQELRETARHQTFPTRSRSIRSDVGKG